MPFFRNADEDMYDHEFLYNYEPMQHHQRGCLPDGCAYRLIPVVVFLALLLFLAINFHPQGFPLIPWLVDHL